MRFPITHYIERGDEEIELSVIYDVSPFVPAILYGDYPQPAEGGEVEIISVKCDGAEFGLYPHEEAALLAACEERAQSFWITNPPKPLSGAHSRGVTLSWEGFEHDPD